MVHAHIVQVGTPSAAKRPGGPGDKSERNPEMAEAPDVFFRQQWGMVIAKPYLTIKRHRRRPIQADILSEEERSVLNYILRRLETIHPNPGPGRDKTEEGKKRRRERRYARRKEKRRERESNTQRPANIMTWNVQRMSLGTVNKRKARNVTEIAQKNGWDAVLLSEIRAEREGVEWIGEGDNLTAIVHSKKAGILLRGQMLKGWTQGGQRKLISDRHVSVKTNGFSLTATYMPVWQGTNQEEIEIEKDILLQHAQWAGKKDVLLIGGDFNAHIGGDEQTPEVCGKFGLRSSNEKGRELIRFCQENQLCFVNSFYNHKNRGTWFNQMNGRWYELDGFLMKTEQRHRHVLKVCTVGEMVLSDHKPKKISIKTSKWHWNNNNKVKKRTPKINWEKLKNHEVVNNFKIKITEILENDENEETEEPERTRWKELTNVLMTAAKEVCGEQTKTVQNPWMTGRDEQVQRLRSRISGAISRRNDIRKRMNEGQPNLENTLQIAVNELREGRKELQRETRRWEREWWESIISECREASERGDSRTMFKTLKQLGKREWKGLSNNTIITTDQFREHFKKVSAERFENTPEEIDRAVNEMEEIENLELKEEWSERLEEIPTREEIVTQLKKMRESAPGEDGIRLIYLLQGGEEIINRLVEIVQFMFCNGSDKWEDELKEGVIIPLFKKGDKNNTNNYRGICLASMGTRVADRIMADRLRIWAEKLNLLDDDQAGFRRGRSTADATQIMIRIQEDATDLRRRMETSGFQIDEDQMPAARLLDLRKAYPRVNKPALWAILSKYGLGPRALRVLQDLHESTRYVVRGREGNSEPWVPERGLKEGSPSSPILFNVYHQVVMRSATKARKRKADEMDETMGITYKWVPGSGFPGEGMRERNNSEAKKICIDKSLFADDTTVTGKKKELVEGLKVVKEEMTRFEEKNNDDKEEELVFGTTDGEKIRMLGSYIGPTEDVKQRIRRGGAAWAKLKPQLKGSSLSKQMQARIAETCVESTMLFDCQVRTWQVNELKKMQSFVDKIYRYIWSRKSKPPLIQMQEERKNMQDVRNDLKIKSLRWKVEKRVLERIGHVCRMDDNRMVKAVTFGWMEDLENIPKVPGRKRKTILYWKKIVKEAGMDTTKMAELTSDRKEWKAKVKKRMKHLEMWEKNAGHRTTEEQGERNQRIEVEEIFRCTWDGCNKICKSKAGLTTHKSRIHLVSNQKVIFKCDKCEETFKAKANLENHKKSCEGIKAVNQNQRQCTNCDRVITKSNFARHRKICRGEEQAERPQRNNLRGACNICGKVLLIANIARHKTKIHNE